MQTKKSHKFIFGYLLGDIFTFDFSFWSKGTRLVLPEQNEFLIFFVSDFILQHYNGHAKSSKYAFFHKIDFGPTKNLVKQEFVKKIRKFR